MNYITQLENELKEVRAELCGLKCGLIDVEAYLLTDKFSIDTTVQTKDVLNRISEAKMLSGRLLAEQQHINHQKEKSQ